MDISIICVNWNSVDYVRDCLASIYEYTHGVSFEIIVVDNDSPEGRLEILQDQFPEITLVRSRTNVGFAGANNLGFKHSTGSYVLFLNPDTKLIGPALNVMLEQMRFLPDAGIFGCKLLNTDLSVQLTSIQKFPTIVNQMLDTEFLQVHWPQCPLWKLTPLFSTNAKPIRVDVISGACMLLRRELFEQVGMFSEDYFMYAEDIDLNYKVTRAGFSNYYVGEATIIHHGGGSSSRQNASQWKTTMKHRAMCRYFCKTQGPAWDSIYRIAMGCVAVARLILLGFAYPLVNILWGKEALKIATEKWRAVLRWAVGRQELA
jgi:GT2 family glycosyltransferase